MKDKERTALESMYSKYNYMCFLKDCFDNATQRAHIIGDTKANRKIYGSIIIDNPLNWLPACALEHNGIIDAGKGAFADRIAELIEADDEFGIRNAVWDNVKRKLNKNGGLN